jgi:hypothetical protein
MDSAKQEEVLEQKRFLQGKGAASHRAGGGLRDHKPPRPLWAPELTMALSSLIAEKHIQEAWGNELS